jgi:DNA-binding CsgD family transcriptional regulator
MIARLCAAQVRSIWLNDRELLWRRAVLYSGHYSKQLARLLIGSPETVLSALVRVL